MLTPTFRLTQSDDVLVASIYAPYVNWQAGLETVSSDKYFYFAMSPYFLRLYLPRRVVLDEECETEYIEETKTFEVIIRKKTPGEHFPDLDLLGTLLDRRIKPKAMLRPDIQELPDCSASESEEEDSDEWLIEQEIPDPPSEMFVIVNAPKYGFGNQTQGVFQVVKTEFKEIIDLPEPDFTYDKTRLDLMRAEENEKFCSDHYLADFMEPQALQEYLAYKTPWAAETIDTVKLTKEEQETLIKFGNKRFLLSKEDKGAAWLSLIDIIFAYAYNHRTTLGENTVESAWTINKLSSTLSWFTTHDSMHSAVVICFRRLLTYSLCRNWDLAQLVFKDTIAIFKLGRRQVLKCLLEINSMFNHSEPRYLLNQLYINEYCIWLQKTAKISDQKLTQFTDDLEKIQILKKDVGFDLEELEQAALLVKKEEEEAVEDGLTKKVQNLKLDESRPRLSSSSSDSDSSSSEDDSDSISSDDSGSISSEDDSSSLDSDDDSSPES